MSPIRLWLLARHVDHPRLLAPAQVNGQRRERKKKGPQFVISDAKEYLIVICQAIPIKGGSPWRTNTLVARSTLGYRCD